MTRTETKGDTMNAGQLIREFKGRREFLARNGARLASEFIQTSYKRNKCIEIADAIATIDQWISIVLADCAGDMSAMVESPE